MSVKLLDANTINKIAAGEVVERPASVVKELVENAIDAGATRIAVEILNGGKSYIKVTDNGVGMNREDASLAIRSHATSKLTSVADLELLTTLGFRGEALPTIASVSKFSMWTRQHGDELGTLVRLTGGRDQLIEPQGCAVGTTVLVEDLFFNTPARKKFLKQTSTESGKISDFLTKLALSRPSIAFKLLNGKNLVLSTPGSGTLIECVESIYGRNMTASMMIVEFQDRLDEHFRITGLVSKPNVVKSYRSCQTFIVNGRVIGCRTISKAVEEAYSSLVPKGSFPLAVLVIEVPASAVDINVHPQKAEVRFEDEGQIYRAVHRAVRKAIESRNFVSGEGGEELAQVALGVESKGGDGAARSGSATTAGIDESESKGGDGAATAGSAATFVESGSVAESEESVKGGAVDGGAAAAGSATTFVESGSVTESGVDGVESEGIGGAAQSISAAQSLSERVESKGGGETASSAAVDSGSVAKSEVDGERRSGGGNSSMAAVGSDSSTVSTAAGDGDLSSISSIVDDVSAGGAIDENLFVERMTSRKLTPIGQVSLCYIIAKDDDGLYIADQHAAHERIIFDRLSGYTDGIPAQQLLVPQPIDFDDREMQLIRNNLELFRQLGFTLDIDDDGICRLMEIPVDVLDSDAEGMLREILSSLPTVDDSFGDDDQQRRVIAKNIREACLAMTACRAAIKSGQELNFRQMQIILDELSNTKFPFTCPHGRPTIIKFDRNKLDLMFKRKGF